MTTRRLFAEKTKVPVAQTRAEIEALLHRCGCTQYATAVDYLSQQARVQFRAQDRIVRFELVLPNSAKLRGDRLDQETRRVWRALLLVIKAKLEAVENRITSFEEEFLAHIVLPNDATVGTVLAPIIAEAYARGRMPQALLGPASETAP